MQAIIDQIYVDIAGFITCADLPSCQAIIDINAAIAALPAQILAQVYWRAFDWSNEFNVPNGSLVTFQWLDWLRVIADTVNHIISVGLPMAGRTDGAVLTRQGSFAVWSDPLTLSCQQVLSCVQPLLDAIQTQLDNICGTVTNCPIIINMLDDIDNLQEQVAILAGAPDAILTCTDVQNCMDPIITGLQNQINTLTTNLTNLEIELDNEVLNLQQQITNHITNDQIMNCNDVMACPWILQLTNDVNNLITNLCDEVANCINTSANVINALNNRFTTSTITQEQVQDWAAELLINGSHTNISFVYNDASNRIDAVVSVPPQFDCDDVATCIETHAPTIEAVQDQVANMFALGTQTGITVNYNDTTGAISLTVNTSGFTEPTPFIWDGVTNQWTLTHQPVLLILINDSGQVMIEWVDYSIAWALITWIVVPWIGDTIYAKYIY